jgi:hypothetical protein
MLSKPAIVLAPVIGGRMVEVFIRESMQDR